MMSRDLLDDFTEYCRDNPDLRFWQALRNWSGQNFIMSSRTREGEGLKDTFYWQARNGQTRSVDAQ